jgi:hypothetical protein
MKNVKPRLLRGLTATIFVALAAAALSALPAFSQATGTVNAHVIAGAAAAPCITITSPASGGTVDFGSRPFNTSNPTVSWPGATDITVANCGTSPETFLARGTNAAAGAAQWSLQSTPVDCNGVLNVYNLMLRGPATDDPTVIRDVLLDSVSNEALAFSVAPNGSLTRSPRIVLPCSGSSGAGLQMSMSYLFTATL